MEKIIILYKKVISSITLVFGILGVAGMIMLVLLTVADVFFRFFFNYPILGSFELTEYLLIPITLFAISWAAREKTNVRVDLFVGKLRSKMRAKVYAVACLPALIVTFVFAWATVPRAFHIYNINIKSDMLRIPAFPFYFIMAFCFFILFLTLIVSLIEYIEEAMER